MGGIIIFMVNKVSRKAHIMEWSSNKLNRVCTSPSGAESLALYSAIGRATLIRRSINKLMGPDCNIDSVIASDSKNTIEAAYSSSTVGDGFNAIDMAGIRDAVNSGEVTRIIKVDSDNQLAEALTKNKPKTVSKLMEVLRSGTLEDVEIDL